MWDEIHRNSRHCATQTQCDPEDEIGRRLKLKARQTDQPTERTESGKETGAPGERATDGGDTCRDAGGEEWTN